MVFKSKILPSSGYTDVQTTFAVLTANKFMIVFFLVFVNDLNTDFISSTKYALASPVSIVQSHDWNDLLMTITEKEKLDLFRETVIKELPENYMKTDFYLVRWLKASHFAVNEAREMLLENFKWRRANKMDSILNEDFSDLGDDCSILFNTHDKKGRPVGVINIGSWNIRSAVFQGRVPRLLRHLDFLFEQLVQQILEAQKAGRDITRAVILVDLEELSFAQHLCSSCENTKSISVYVRMMTNLESHYPGFFEEYIIINAPGIFQIVLNTLQGVMSEQTREVLKVFDTNERQWTAYLDERIERNQRYLNFGGTKQARDC